VKERRIDNTLLMCEEEKTNRVLRLAAVNASISLGDVAGVEEAGYTLAALLLDQYDARCGFDNV
jgi:hypothetical protein